jgi:flavin prenyltransferase
MRIIVGVTGASGALYGYSMIRYMAHTGIEVHAIYTPMGERVLQYECGFGLEEVRKYACLHANDDLFSSVASGSFKTKGMAVVPCSMHTLGYLASGAGEDLLTRAADVTLKEGRKLIIVPREAPVTAIHLENMLKLTHAGAVILPASPAFYHHPRAMSDLITFVLGKIMDSLDIDHQLFKRWGEGIPE